MSPDGTPTYHGDFSVVSGLRIVGRIHDGGGQGSIAFGLLQAAPIFALGADLYDPAFGSGFDGAGLELGWGVRLRQVATGDGVSPDYAILEAGSDAVSTSLGVGGAAGVRTWTLTFTGSDVSSVHAQSDDNASLDGLLGDHMENAYFLYASAIVAEPTIKEVASLTVDFGASSNWRRIG